MKRIIKKKKITAVHLYEGTFDGKKNNEAQPLTGKKRYKKIYVACNGKIQLTFKYNAARGYDLGIWIG